MVSIPKILNGAVEVVPINSIKPHPLNPNVGDVKVIKGSVEALGFYGYVICQKPKRKGRKGIILAGAHRWMALKEAGATEVPVQWLEVDDATALDIVLVDNRSSELGVRDKDKLVAALKVALKASEDGRDLRGTGYTPRDAAKMIKAAAGAKTDTPEEPWPIVHMRMPPAVYVIWTRWLERMREKGEPNWKCLERMLERLDRE